MRQTIVCRQSVVERLHAAAYWLPGHSVSAIAESAIDARLNEIEGREITLTDPDTGKGIIKAAGAPFPVPKKM